jgi:hypothetical protein
VTGTTLPAIDPERLSFVQALPLNSGGHDNIDEGMCVMEAVSYVAGEPWSDSPACASPLIAAFLRSWNDSLDDEARNRPLIPKLVGTRGTEAVEERRSYLALDWLIRVFTPKWLDMVPALHEHAKALRELEAIADTAGAAAAGERVRAAEAAARVAAWGAAWGAASDATGDAAGGASWDAVRAVDWDAAKNASGAAAINAAWAAAGAAARDAGGAALKPTTEWLQASALDLVDRMLAA